MIISSSLLSIFSVLGWANFVEPNLVQTTKIFWKLPKKWAYLSGLKIVQISDLHFNDKVPSKFLKKVSQKISSCNPDIICFCGDFFCRGRIEDQNRFVSFAQTLKPKLCAVGVLGNHDYASYVSCDDKGYINVIPQHKSAPFKRAYVAVAGSLFKKEYKYNFHPEHASVNPHSDIVQLLKRTPFQLLHNENISLPIGLNIVGLGDLFAKQFIPQKAFENYNPELPGIILSHNPDTVKFLMKYPGERILSGHSHGPQLSIAYPKFARKFMERLSGLEDPHLSRGEFQLTPDKTLYVTRGLGGLKRTRFCSLPEVCCLECV